MKRSVIYLHFFFFGCTCMRLVALEPGYDPAREARWDKAAMERMAAKAKPKLHPTPKATAGAVAELKPQKEAKKTK